VLGADGALALAALRILRGEESPSIFTD
jgi:hypothetical protein